MLATSSFGALGLNGSAAVVPLLLRRGLATTSAAASQYVLTVNAGSSSLKYSLFPYMGSGRVPAKPVIEGLVERIGAKNNAFIKHQRYDEKFEETCEANDHREALQLLMRNVTDGERGVLSDFSGVVAVGHRVVHGGELYKGSVAIDDDVVQGLRDLSSLAPLHNPVNVMGIEAARTVLPDATHVAVLDTSFHSTLPPHAYMYAVPASWYDTHKVRRYGFHGTSHLYVSRRASALLGKQPADTNCITAHIGNGVSMCAVRNGCSVDTSMGFTPLEGLIMGTRCGDLDPALIPFLCRALDKRPVELDRLLNKESGIKGITNGRYVDRRDVLAEAEKGDVQAQLALDMEAYRLRKYIGAYMAALGRTDAIVFTAGVGERAWRIREMVIEQLPNVSIDSEKNQQAVDGTEQDITGADSTVRVLVVPTNESLVIAEDSVAVLEGTYSADNLAEHVYSFQKADYVAD